MGRDIVQSANCNSRPQLSANRNYLNTAFFTLNYHPVLYHPEFKYPTCARPLTLAVIDLSL